MKSIISSQMSEMQRKYDNSRARDCEDNGMERSGDFCKCGNRLEEFDGELRCAVCLNTYMFTSTRWFL